MEKSESNRVIILTNHYRMPVEFNDESLLGAKNGAKRLINSIAGYEIGTEYDKDIITEFENEQKFAQ